jgi:hypothetical protein
MQDRYLARTREPPVRLSRARGDPRMLVSILVFGALAMAMVAYVLWPRWPDSAIDASAPAVPVTVAGVTFNVPPAAIRVPLQRRPGVHERIDLSFVWPSLDPPAANAKPRIEGTAEASPQPAERIFVTITAAESSISPAERALTIYPRFVETEAAPGPGGLVLLPFRDGTPYQGEDLIYDGDAPGFLVRCTRQVASTPGTCLYERWIETAKLVLRFPRAWLTDWRMVAANFERLIARLRPSHG